MEYHVFKQTLKDHNLTMKAFAELSGIKYDTCSKWGKDNRPVSDWVASWFELYSENKDMTELKQIIRKTICDKESL